MNTCSNYSHLVRTHQTAKCDHWSEIREIKRRISIIAIFAFQRAQEIENAYTDDIWEEDGGRRREYLNAITVLHRELGLQPWQYGPISVIDGKWVKWVAIDDWRLATRLRRALTAAHLRSARG